MTRVNKLLTKIFPSEMTPNIYAYPEVKILNYLDAQYYGYALLYAEKSISELLLRHSESSSILDPPISGSPPRNAESHRLATSTNTSIPQRAPPMSTMEHTSTSPMDPVQFQDSWDRILLGLLASLPRIPSLLRSPSCTESASLPPSSTASSEWPGHRSQSTAFP